MINKQINNICKYTKMNYLLICSLALLTDKFVKCFLHFFFIPMLELLSSSYCYLFVYLFIFVFKDTLFTNSQTSRNAK